MVAFHDAKYYLCYCHTKESSPRKLLWRGGSCCACAEYIHVSHASDTQYRHIGRHTAIWGFVKRLPPKHSHATACVSIRAFKSKLGAKKRLSGLRVRAVAAREARSTHSEANINGGGQTITQTVEHQQRRSRINGGHQTQTEEVKANRKKPPACATKKRPSMLLQMASWTARGSDGRALWLPCMRVAGRTTEGMLTR